MRRKRTQQTKDGTGRPLPLWRSSGLLARLVLPCFAVLCMAATGSAAARGHKPHPNPRSHQPAASRPAPPAVSAMNGFGAARLGLPGFEQQMAAMRSHGVQVVRIDAPWAVIEPQPPGPAGHSWQFAQTDAWAVALAVRHLTWEPLLDYSVGWAKTCPGNCPPTDDSTYAAFARAVAARYGEHGSFWAEHPELPYYPARIFEVWNEENTSVYWSTGPNAGQYARLYMAARAAIKAVDPPASVIVGGLAGPDVAFNPQQDYPAQFVQHMLTAQPSLRGHIDGFGLHPYAPSAQDSVEWTVHFREVLDTLGEGSAPIDITEFGWPAGVLPARETWRGWMLNTIAYWLGRSNCGIGLLAPYDWINPLNAQDSPDFGLVGRAGTSTTLRGSGATWFHALKLAASTPERMICSAPGRRGHTVGSGDVRLIPTGPAPPDALVNIFSLAHLLAGGGQASGAYPGRCWALAAQPWNDWLLALRRPRASRVTSLTVKRACGSRVRVS